MSQVPVTNTTPEDQQPCPVPLTHAAKEDHPRPDQRQARIASLSDELADRNRFIQIVQQSGGFDRFLSATMRMQGHLDGLQESLTIAPPTTTLQEGN